MIRCLALLLAMWGQARAQDPARVAVVAELESDPMAQRLLTELRAVSLEPVLLVRSLTDTPEAELAALRQQASSVALFAVDSEDHAVQVHVPVPGSDDTVSAELVWPDGDRVAEAMVGVQAVELLRAGLIESRAELVGNRARRMTLSELALTVGGGPQRKAQLMIGSHAEVGTLTTGPQAAVALGGRVDVLGRVFVGVGGILPVARARYDGAAGELHLGVGRAELGLGTRLVGSGAQWIPDVGIATGVSVTSLAYTAGPLFLGADERSFLRPHVGLRSGLCSPRWGPLAGRADLRIDGSAPVSVALAKEPAGRWGPVSIGLGLGLDVLL